MKCCSEKTKDDLNKLREILCPGVGKLIVKNQVSPNRSIDSIQSHSKPQ